MEQFMENKQGYVIDNLNAVAGCGVGEVRCSSEEILGVKFDEQLHEENDVGDDDELKYAKEVQQSEKQHSMENVGDGRNSNELAEKEEKIDKYEVGIKEENMHNQKDFESTDHNYNKDDTNGHGVHYISDESKQIVDDLSPIGVSSGTEYVGNSNSEDYHDNCKADNGVDLSSTISATNGSSQLHAVPCVEETTSPFIAAAVGDNTSDVNMEQSVQNNDYEAIPSQLNPEAKEFVPTFETNMLSPISPSDTPLTTLNDEELERDYFGQAPSAVPRLFIPVDDFVAQSPRKGRGDNMDTIFVPAVQEFEEEADQRPHELEANDQINNLDENILNPNKDYQDNSNDLIVSQDSQFETESDFIDNSLIDHGPETLVDLVGDIIAEQQSVGPSEKDNDPMNQSIYVTNEEAIENVLNSVQPIPTEIDSVNNSFTEEMYVAASVGDKELLQIEEKEHISKSPSTEEIQINLLQSQNYDVSQAFLEIKDPSIMHDSSYAVQAEVQGTNQCAEDSNYSAAIDNSQIVKTADEKDETLNHNTTNSEKELAHNAPNSSPAEEKHLLEDTKESEINILKPCIEDLMSEMAISDDKICPQVRIVILLN